MDIRRLRLEELVKEAGSFAAIERQTGVVANLLSQCRGGKNIGDKLARKLEGGMGKPRGWMDSLNFASPEEAMNAAEVATAMAILSQEDRDAVLKHVRLLVKNTPKGTPENPYGNAPKPPTKGGTQ